MKGLVICFVAVAAIMGCVSAKPGNKIVGGERVKIEDYPYQVSLQVVESHFCGASIIGKRQLVTAAHCTDGWMIRFLSIRAGSTYHADGGQVIKVAEVKQHPGYNPKTMDNDISIIILEEDLTFNDSVQPIALPSEGEHVPEGTDAVVTGWGDLYSNGPSPDDLRGVTIPIITNEDCQAAYPYRTITDRMICAGYIGIGGKDACQGDSGGPLKANGKLIGVVSWGYGCADPEHPGVFANVANLRSYIKENAGI